MIDIERRDFFDVIGSRRSVRYFKPWKPVEPEKLESFLQAARIASHMGNANAVHAIEFIDKSARPRLTNFPTEAVDFMLSCESGMAMAQAQLTAVALGLGVCSFAGVGPKISEVFGLPDHCRFVWGMAIGYPAEDPLTGGQRKRKTL